MPDQPEKPETQDVELRDIEPEKDPQGGRKPKRPSNDPCDGGE